MKEALLIQELGANLVSARRLCKEHGIKGAFDDEVMSFHKKGKTLLSAFRINGIYIVDHISKSFSDTISADQTVYIATDDIELNDVESTVIAPPAVDRTVVD